MARPNLLYAQSGGVTAVINATAYGIIDEARGKVGKILAGRDGILGILNEQLINVSAEQRGQINRLRHTPGGAFGSCRLKLPAASIDEAPYRRLVEVFLAHNIGYFLYNGGNDSQDTTNKIAQYCNRAGVKVNCIGVPKTVDNDLATTDCCPGFGSVAKYIATTVSETMLDVASMHRTSTKLFIIEVMGRHAGWIAAAGGLAAEQNGPLIIAFPEVAHSWPRFFSKIKEKVAQHGYCCVVASEGLADSKGRFLSERGTRDSFAHSQLGGVAGILAERAKEKMGLKYHWALADYMQRAARHLASATDVKHAEAVGRHAVRYALADKSQVMPAIIRTSDSPYRWKILPVPLSKVANRERKMPQSFITSDGYFITSRCRKYLTPLISGEDPPPFADGLPVHANLRLSEIKQTLSPWRG